ncbi:MAG: permease prefix domain 1-containing protein [Acidobacteriaceae bacterium]
MNWLAFGFRRFFKRQEIERELDEELASHIAMETDLRVRAGDSPEAARSGALNEFGNMGLVAEVTRELPPWLSPGK